MTIAGFLVAALPLSLTGCGGGTSGTTEDAATVETVEQNKQKEAMEKDYGSQGKTPSPAAGEPKK